MFAIGKHPDNRIEMLQAKRMREERSRQRRLAKPIPPNPKWRIIPDHATSPQYAFYLDMLPGSYQEKLQALSKRTISLVSFVPTDTTISIREEIKKVQEEVRKLIEKNQWVLWQMKRIFNAWIYKNLRTANDTDPITLAPIVKKVYITSIKDRIRYVYEVDSIMKDIHKRLLHTDGQIPFPLYPRNPLTNEKLTIQQLTSVFASCKEQGFTTWALESFRTEQFCIRAFLEYNRKKLRMQALSAIYLNMTSVDYIDMMIDFMDTQHNEHDVNFNSNVYLWSVVHLPEDPRILKWKDLCKKWYEIDILIDDPFEKDKQFNKIETQTLEICSPPHELVVKRKLYLSGLRGPGLNL